jgi:prophage regulatory protein
MHTSPTPVTADRFLRLPEVSRRTGLSRSTLYRLAAAGAFPAPVKITARSSGWPESTVAAWMAERIQRTETTNGERPSGRELL